MIEILPVQIEHIASLNRAVNSVCAEKKYLSSISGFTVEQTTQFVQMIILSGATQIVALDGGRVVGWCDIVPETREMHRHVGILGMGIIDGYRGQGLGRLLIEAALTRAFAQRLERITLEVFEQNTRALALYEKVGFKREGVKVRAKKFEGEYDNVICMAIVR